MLKFFCGQRNSYSLLYTYWVHTHVQRMENSVTSHFLHSDKWRWMKLQAYSYNKVYATCSYDSEISGPFVGTDYSLHVLFFPPYFHSRIVLLRAFHPCIVPVIFIGSYLYLNNFSRTFLPFFCCCLGGQVQVWNSLIFQWWKKWFVSHAYGIHAHVAISCVMFVVLLSWV